MINKATGAISLDRSKPVMLKHEYVSGMVEYKKDCLLVGCMKTKECINIDLNKETCEAIDY